MNWDEAIQELLARPDVAFICNNWKCPRFLRSAKPQCQYCGCLGIPERPICEYYQGHVWAPVDYNQTPPRRACQRCEAWEYCEPPPETLNVHGVQLCPEAFDAHNECCCERCHQVGRCPYGSGVVLGVAVSVGPHDYPHPEALRDGLVIPASQSLSCETGRC